MPDARIKDCVCAACAKKMGYEPGKDVAGVWMGECDFCGERKPLTSLSHDWRRVRTGEAATVAGDKETVAEIVSEMRDRNAVRKVRLRQYGSVHVNCSVAPDDLPGEYADRVESSHDREVSELKRLHVIHAKQAAQAIRGLNMELFSQDRQIAELRECLKEAVEWACGNPDEACEDCVAHGGDTPCKCEKWRKVLEGAKDGK